MTNKLDIGLITVARKISTGSVVLWDSEQLVMSTNFNMTELTRSLVLKESLISETNMRLNEKVRLIARDTALSQKNYVEGGECDSKLKTIASVFGNCEVKFIEQVKMIDLFDKDILAVREGEAQSLYTMLSKYINDLEVLRLNSYILLTNLNDALNTIDNLEEATFSYRDKVNALYNDLLDLENRVNLILYQLAMFKTRVDPAVRDLYKLRIYAYELLSKYKLLYDRLIRLEVAIAANFAKLCRAEQLLSQAKQELMNLTALISRLEARMASCIKRLFALDQVIAEVFSLQLLVTKLANDIADFISKMTKFINEGLVKPGNNIQIEYNNSGNAIIHANLPEYPKRKRPVQQCFPQTPINVEFPAPPCPPVIPPCPTTTTTTTTTPAPIPATCNVAENANGGSGVFTKDYNFAPWVGCVSVTYDMYNQPDAMDILLDGVKVASTGGLVSGSKTLVVKYNGSGVITVKVTGGGSGTAWAYQIKCGPC